LQRFSVTLFFRCQCTDGEARQQRRLYDVQQTPAVEGNSKRRRLTFQNKAAEAEDSPSQRTRRAFLRSRTRREILVREWGKLGSAIRRAAAVCLTPSTGADEDDELDLPYVQLHKVTRAVSGGGRIKLEVWRIKAGHDSICQRP
jgi:hypothetical protein